MSFLKNWGLQPKLALVVSGLLLVSLTAMIMVATYFFKKDSAARIREQNLALAEITAVQVKTDISHRAEWLKTLARILKEPGWGNQEIAAGLFRDRPECVAMGIFTPSSQEPVRGWRKNPYADPAPEEGALAQAAARWLAERDGVFRGAMFVMNASDEFHEPMLAIFLPAFSADGSGEALLGFFRASAMKESIRRGSDLATIFVIDGKGRILLHPEDGPILKNEDRSESDLVKNVFSSVFDNGQLRSRDHGKWMFGSYRKVGLAGLTAIVTVPEDKALEAVYQIQRRNLYVAIIVLHLAILITYFFSKTITRPLRELTKAAKRIQKGEYLQELHPKNEDEIGKLTLSFVAMGRGLHERERLKKAFGMFVSDDVVARAIRGEIKLGGDLQTATVLFSDIRDFTSISENLRPDELVALLNDYLSLMVECVERHGGTIDKFIGDAIMATWGVPRENPQGPFQAVSAAVEMFEILEAFNRDRAAMNRPKIRIGVGIHTGKLVSGQIGSRTRMEYTVVGDTVNLASRIESLNKDLGTDILVSENCYRVVRDAFVTIPMGLVDVKGKSEKQRVYSVLGIKGSAPAFSTRVKSETIKWDGSAASA